MIAADRGTIAHSLWSHRTKDQRRRLQFADGSLLFPPKARTLLSACRDEIRLFSNGRPMQALSRRRGGSPYHRFHRNKRPVNSMGKCHTCGKAGKVEVAVDRSGKIGENDRCDRHVRPTADADLLWRISNDSHDSTPGVGSTRSRISRDQSGATAVGSTARPPGSRERQHY